MKPLLIALVAAVTFVTLPANAGGSYTVQFPTLTYPEPQPDTTKDCVDATSVSTDSCTKQ